MGDSEPLVNGNGAHDSPFVKELQKWVIASCIATEYDQVNIANTCLWVGLCAMSTRSW